MPDSSTFSDTEQTENSPEPDRAPERAEARLAEAQQEVPEVDNDVPNIDVSRSGGASFLTWSTAVAQLLHLDSFSDHELAGLGVTGALSRAFQVDDLSPRSFAEGVAAAVAIQDDQAAARAEVAEAQAARNAEADAFADVPQVVQALPSSPDLTEAPEQDPAAEAAAAKAEAPADEDDEPEA